MWWLCVYGCIYGTRAIQLFYSFRLDRLASLCVVGTLLVVLVFFSTRNSYLVRTNFVDDGKEEERDVKVAFVIIISMLFV